MRNENREKICVECEPTEQLISKIYNNKFPPHEFLPIVDKINTVSIDMGNKYANRYIFYYAAESKKMLMRDGKFKKPIYELEAYDDFNNSGIAKLNEKGIIEVSVSEPIEYLANDGVIYDRHLHFKISNKENEFWTDDEFTIKINNSDSNYKYYDIVIIGGGIAGLYSAYKLSKDNDHSILILERNDYLGGRIKTIKKNIDGEEIQFDVGASRLNENHTLVKKLIDELDLSEDIYNLKQTKLIPLSRGVTYNTDNITNEKYNLEPYINVQDLINKVIKKSNIYNEDFLTSINFIDLATLILTSEEISYIKDIYTYDAELYNFNSYDALRMFRDDLNLKSRFYILKSGMSILCDKLVEILSKKNVDIMTETEFIEYEYIDNLFNIKAINNYTDINIKSSSLILAIPYEFLNKIKQFESISYLINSVNQIGLNRIYAKYPENKSDNIWFNGVNKIGTNNMLKFIIPINTKKGLIMISYTDSEKSIYWNILDNYGIMEKEIHNNITKLFPLENIPRPQFINSYFWKGGIHFYKPGFNYKIVGSKIIKPFDNQNLFIVGECYSDKQGWIEGALRSVENMLKLV